MRYVSRSREHFVPIDVASNAALACMKRDTSKCHLGRAPSQRLRLHEAPWIASSLQHARRVPRIPMCEDDADDSVPLPGSTRFRNSSAING